MTLASCHKSSQAGAAPPNCQLTGITVTSGSTTATYQLDYNSAGKLATVHFADPGGSYTKSFTYSGNLIVAHTVSTSNTTDSVFLNANGDIDSMRSYNGNGNLTTSIFSRNGSGQVVQSLTRFSSNTTATTTFSYNGGDIASQYYPTDTLNYSYYTDKTTVTGDYLLLPQWLNYGAAYQTVKHLFKGFSSAKITQGISYTFDGDGKISSLTVNTNSLGNVSAQVYQFTYQCH